MRTVTVRGIHRLNEDAPGVGPGAQNEPIGIGRLVPVYTSGKGNKIVNQQYWGFSHGKLVDPAVALETARKLFAQRFGRPPRRVLVREGVEVPDSGLDVEQVTWLARNTFYFLVDEVAS